MTRARGRYEHGHHHHYIPALSAVIGSVIRVIAACPPVITVAASLHVLLLRDMPRRSERIPAPSTDH